MSKKERKRKLNWPSFVLSIDFRSASIIKLSKTKEGPKHENGFWKEKNGTVEFFTINDSDFPGSVIGFWEDNHGNCKMVGTFDNESETKHHISIMYGDAMDNSDIDSD